MLISAGFLLHEASTIKLGDLSTVHRVGALHAAACRWCKHRLQHMCCINAVLLPVHVHVHDQLCTEYDLLHWWTLNSSCAAALLVLPVLRPKMLQSCAERSSSMSTTQS